MKEIFCQKESSTIWLTNDLKRLDLNFVQNFLKATYWAKDLSVDELRKSLETSVGFGLFDQQRPIGFARVLTDYRSIAFLFDVFIVNSYQRRGLAKWMLNTIFDLEDLRAIRRWWLATEDAQELYKKLGFVPLRNPGRYWERTKPLASFSNEFNNTLSHPTPPLPSGHSIKS